MNDGGEIEPSTPVIRGDLRRGGRPTASERRRGAAARAEHCRSAEEAARERAEEEEAEDAEDAENNVGDGEEDDAEYEELTVNPDVADLMVEEDISSDSERAPRQSRAIEAAAVDVSGLTEEEARKKRLEFKKQRAREARQRYSEKRKMAVAEASADAPKLFRIKCLDAVRTERDGIENYLQAGDEFDSKARLCHHICELAEHYCLTVHLPRNTKVDVKAYSEDQYGKEPHPLFVHATFRMADNKWVVKKVKLSGVMGQGPQLVAGRVEQNWRKNQARTAFTEEQLAFHAKTPIQAQPSLSRKSLVALFAGVIRFPDQIPSDVWSRVRRKAYNFAFGIPNDNVSRLPALRAEMEKHGHSLEFESCDGNAMVASILSVRKAECERNRRKANRVPVSSRTARDVADLAPWTQQVSEFLLKHDTYLKELRKPGAKYVNYVAFSFKFVTNQFPLLLHFVSVDACFGKTYLDAFQVFSASGVTSNGNVVTLGYVLICGNESEETWTRAWEFFKNQNPTLGKMTTVISDGDKGIVMGLQNSFPENDRPYEMRCSKHRAENIRLRHGAAAKAQYWKCVKATTVEKIASIKLSAEFRALKDTAKAALNSVADKNQFPASAVASGAVLYGRNSNQLSEVDNSAIETARHLDPFLFVLWNGDRAVRLYTKFAQEARECQTMLTPWSVQALGKVKKLGEAQAVNAEFTADYHVFKVIAERVVHKVFLRVPPPGSADQSRFPVDQVPCTCGVPEIENMPCGHMVAVAEATAISTVLLVPLAHTAAAWDVQYPDVPVFCPTYADVLASTVPRDVSLKMPVAAPPKRGRPAKRRLRGVMERVARKARLNDGS